MTMLESSAPQQYRAAIRSSVYPKVSLFTTSLQEGNRQAAKDFRARWRRCGLWCLAAIWFLALIFALIALILIDTGIRSRLEACLPDGSFTVAPQTFRYFSRSGFFEITLAFGSMTFTQVKALDVAWDILVGRGGQSFLAYISWRVFANYVTTSMEVMPVTFRTYRTIFFQNGSLLVGIPRLIRDFCSRHALHSRLAMVFMVFTMALSLAFPTLVSSLTGYKAKVDPFVKTTQGIYVPFSSFDFVSYIIHDGWRLNGFQGNHIVLAYGSHKDSHDPVIQDGDMISVECFGFYQNSEFAPCYIPMNVTDYVTKYISNGSHNVASTFMGQELPSPVLNISTFSVPKSWRVPGSWRVPLSLSSGPMLWAYENTTYSQDDMMENGKCQPNLSYQWGFSFIQSFITVILLFIWSIGIYIMWLHSHSTIKRRGRTDIAGEHKAVLELAQAMQQQHAGLASPIKEQHEREEKDGASATTTAVAIPVTEASLHHRITNELRGGSIAYTAPLLANGKIADGWTLWSSVKTHKWSVAGTVLSCLVSFLSGISLHFNIFIVWPLPVELAAALYIGSTRASRAVIFFWGFVVCSIVPQIVLSALRV